MVSNGPAGAKTPDDMSPVFSSPLCRFGRTGVTMKQVTGEVGLPHLHNVHRKEELPPAGLMGIPDLAIIMR